ncbi:MAG TPA: indolepyruvate ferredoxin oxidoreductase subunit alpha [bacterium]|nr:indolepyruvate ferredoxin oxidoreductase subunit alpha [bacterium]
MNPLLSPEPTVRLLLGNEAIVRGALEAGLGFFSTYPGTPSSEIGDTFFRLHQEAGVLFEYSVNEKVALEVAGAAAAAGVRTMVAMKHVGVNVAADPLMTLAYIGVRAGLVLVSADDPGCHSSQNEQDNRHYARLGKLPMLEPATPQEAYETVKAAFALSEKLEMPVILRTTTRVSHTRSAVRFGVLGARKTKGEFAPDRRRFTPVPAVARLRHPVVEQNMIAAEEQFNDSPLNRTYGKGAFGVLTSGVAACYVEDAVVRFALDDKVRVLQLATTWPLPRRLLAEFVAQVDAALVVEELDPLLENELRATCSRSGKLIPVYGKESGHFSMLGELGPDPVTHALADLLGFDAEEGAGAALPALPARPPVLCPGCPHRATYYAVKLVAGDEPLYLSDIGCYTLGFLPPIGVGDYFICMGSSASSAGGFAATGDKPVISFIGDSTFFHSGMTGLVNSVHNRRDMTLVVLDNRTTGMTGHQPNPGSGVRGETIDIERVARAAGVEHIAAIDPLNFKESTLVIRNLLAQNGTKVLISRSPCPLFARKQLGQQRAAAYYRVDDNLCRVCGRGEGGQCGLETYKDYGLTRSRARIAALPESDEGRTPHKMQHPPCETACPLGLCVQGYIEHVAAGNLAVARALIRQRLALPHTICRVCPHPCETACVRGDIDEPLAINKIKRFVMDAETDDERRTYIAWQRNLIRENGKRVAVIGGGPAGLGCAFDLRLRGYEVTIFEAEAAAGGMCGYGIPRHRLPRAALAKDLAVIEGLGVSIETGRRFGADLSLDELRERGFAAAFVSVGMTRGLRLGIAGETLPHVQDAMHFLRRVNLGGLDELAGHVVVVGGGNAAIDAARCALRLGANAVTIIYRRTHREMPAIAEEVEAALAEGVKLVELSTPESIEKNGDRLTLFCRRMTLGEPDEEGRRKPLPTEQTFTVVADHVVVAIGQQPAVAPEALPVVERDRWGRMRVERDTGATDNPFLFAGGDAVTGPASVAEALQSGKIAAYGIDKQLAEHPEAVAVEAWRDIEAMTKENRYEPQAVEVQLRRTAPKLVPADAGRSWDEVEGGYSPADAIAEAKRCLACGLCACCDNCLSNFGCPAFYRQDGQVRIDPILCDGCGTCVQICPNGAIVPVRELNGGVS